jgi:hypothetical protein
MAGAPLSKDFQQKPVPGMRYFVGLDLGQAQEYTALAILERPRVHDTTPRDQRRPA